MLHDAVPCHTEQARDTRITCTRQHEHVTARQEKLQSHRRRNLQLFISRQGTSHSAPSLSALQLVVPDSQVSSASLHSSLLS